MLSKDGIPQPIRLEVVTLELKEEANENKPVEVAPSPYATISSEQFLKLNPFLKSKLDKLGVFEFGFILSPDFKCTQFEDGFYSGELDNKGRRHGKGVCIFKDCSLYEGHWAADDESSEDYLKGKPSGLGRLIDESGGVYQGNFKDGKRDGPLGQQSYAADGGRWGYFG